MELSEVDPGKMDQEVIKTPENQPLVEDNSMEKHEDIPVEAFKSKWHTKNDMDEDLDMESIADEIEKIHMESMNRTHQKNALEGIKEQMTSISERMKTMEDGNAKWLNVIEDKLIKKTFSYQKMIEDRISMEIKDYQQSIDQWMDRMEKILTGNAEMMPRGSMGTAATEISKSELDGNSKHHLESLEHPTPELL